MPPMPIPYSKKSSSSRLLRALLAGSGCGLLLQSPALRADEGDAFRYGGGATVQYESNVFRRSDDSPAGAPSDTSFRGYGLLGFDKTWSRQRFYGDFIFGRVHYAEFSELDYNRQDFNAGWKGNFPGNINTGLDWKQTQSLANLSDLLVKRRNVITRDNIDGTLDIPLVANWHLLGGAGYQQSRNSNDIDKVNDLNGVYGEGGARYLTNYGNQFDLVYRELHSEYVRRDTSARVDTRYVERSADLRVRWAPTGNNSLEGFVGFVRREHETLDYRNFAGPSFRLSDTWTLGGSTTLVTTIYRTMGAAGDSEFDYAVTKGLRIAPTYQISAKMSLTGAFEWQDRRYFGSYSSEVLNLPNVASGRTYDDKTLELGLNYQALRWLRTRLSYIGQRRDAQTALSEFSSHTVLLDAQLSF
ncbi:outer membrane beta-barrel protein [Niveibacterium sp. SC-1]|uniref:outer membrane beta-barrel protein n=1 Tax=Niveibacterium sp. SC-1 TaxID=3135646 RepID=UPI00311ECBF2